MSHQAMVNVIDDDDLSSQGSVNALVVPLHATTPEKMTAQAPTELVGPPPPWTQDMT